MTSRKGHPFATRQLGTFLSCRQMGTVLAGPAGEPANRQRLPPMTRRSFKTVPNDHSWSFKSVPNKYPMTRWLGVGFVVREG